MPPASFDPADLETLAGKMTADLESPPTAEGVVDSEENQGIEAVYTSPGKAKLTSEQQRLAWKYYTDFVRQGAKLTPEQKKTLSDYNQRLATLYTKFSQNELADEEILPWGRAS